MARPLLLVIGLALLVLMPPVGEAQASDPVSLIGLERSGDILSVTMRAELAVHSVSIRLLDGTAVAGLPTWEPGAWYRGQVATWNFTLLRDLDTATLAWRATVFGQDPSSGAISIVVPEVGFDLPVTLLSLERVDGALSVAMVANENLSRAAVRLLSDGAIVGLPDWQRSDWGAGETAVWRYQLLRQVDRATLSWETQGASGPARSGSLEVQIPQAATAAPTARLLVTAAELAGTTARVVVSNYGGAGARNVLVAMEDAAQKRIGSPLTRLLAEISEGGQAEASFDLPQGVTDVVVMLDHANATTRTPLTLQRVDRNASEATGELNVSLATDLPFREVDLGRSADYAVQVRNQGAPALVQLRVEGLPAGYSARFFVGGSAVPSLYLDRNQTRQATLTVTVPSAKEEVDRTADFAVLASVNGTQAGRLAMGVAVRGVGQPEVVFDGGEQPMAPGGIATFQLSVRNAGTAPLFNIELDSRRPYGWTVRAEPRRIDRLDPGESGAISVEVRAPDVIGSGRYAVDVAAKAGETTSRYTALAMNVEEPEQGGGWVWGVMLAAVAGILGFAAWWKWRA